MTENISKILNMKRLITSLDKLSLKIDELRNRKETSKENSNLIANPSLTGSSSNKICLISRTYCRKENGRCMCKPYMRSSLPSIQELSTNASSRKRKYERTRADRIPEKFRTLTECDSSRIPRIRPKIQRRRNALILLPNKRAKKDIDKELSQASGMSQRIPESCSKQSLIDQCNVFESGINTGFESLEKMQERSLSQLLIHPSGFTRVLSSLDIDREQVR